MPSLAPFARIQEEEAKSIPPGMVLMSEEERQKTLDMLFQSKAKIEEDLRGMPLVVETPSMMNKQNQLYAKLREVEEALKVSQCACLFLVSYVSFLHIAWFAW